MTAEHLLVKSELPATELGKRSFDMIELIVNNLSYIPEVAVPMAQYFFGRTNSNDRVPYDKLTKIIIGSYQYKLNYTGDTSKKVQDDSIKGDVNEKIPIQTRNIIGLRIHKTSVQSDLNIASLDLTSFFDEYEGNKEFRRGLVSMTDQKGHCPSNSEKTFKRIAIEFPELLVHPDRPRIILL